MKILILTLVTTFPILTAETTCNPRPDSGTSATDGSPDTGTDSDTASDTTGGMDPTEGESESTAYLTMGDDTGPDPVCEVDSPCDSNADCGDGTFCPTAADNFFGIVGFCVANCSVGCCADNAWCEIDPNSAGEKGICRLFSDPEALGCPHSMMECWAQD